jgi:hypothetical protein
MKELTTTNDVSYAESVRIALETHGIRAVVSRPNSALPSGAGGFVAGGITISIAHDADLERARAVLAEVVESPNPLAMSRADVRRIAGFMLKAALAILLIAALWTWRHGG